ncbi:KAT8 regulatory NSL complex subunit 2 isoform X2 [Aplysia californica]|uniref:KAT8 regulatory NSL complex subunit 2 n=1 Tax=Aplysia californica TaxID=6500 RepID=A0ABM0K2Y3_APLCA|nr:KAT8 regulatory NSL complex subunit 2 isoform X2 [Aplysia californica]
MNRSLKTQLVNAVKLRSSQEGAFCKYSHRECMQNCIEGYDYCLRHILEDKTAPFKQCAFITKSGRRCPIAALKQERKDGFCMEHGKKSLITRQRLNRKRRPRETADGLLEELANSNSGLADFMNSDHRRGKAHSDSLAEYASSSDSDTEPTLVEQAWRDDGDSDAESIDSDQEDMLKYAGVYTTEEVAQILRDKLIRLQALYIDQFKRLRHILLNKRRQYLQAYKVERESLGSLKLYKKDPLQRLKYDKLCAMKRYHKKFGKDALLQKQSTERRMKATEGLNYQPISFPKCVFVDDGVRCCARVIPLSKFCQKHILHDPGQVLYRPCPFADSQCGRPVPILFNTGFCSLHQRIGTFKVPEPCPLEVKLPDLDVKLEPAVAESPTLPSGLASRRISHTRVSQELDIKMEVDETDELSSTSSLLFGEKMSVPESKGGAEPNDSRPSGEESVRPPDNGGMLFTLGEEDEDEDGLAR